MEIKVSSDGRGAQNVFLDSNTLSKNVFLKNGPGEFAFSAKKIRTKAPRCPEE